MKNRTLLISGDGGTGLQLVLVRWVELHGIIRKDLPVYHTPYRMLVSKEVKMP